MLKSGLIVGGITLVLAIIGGFILPAVCIPCVALFAGAGAGYLAGQFDRPGAGNLAAQNGAKAGAIAGVGALIGHLVGGVWGAVSVGPEGAAALAESLGLPADGNPAVFYGSALVTSCCFGLFEVALMAGLGALGGYLWFQMVGSKGGVPPAPAAPRM